MDADARPLSGPEPPRSAFNTLWLIVPFYVLILIPTTCFLLYMGFTKLQNFGRIKFSMELVVYTGIGLDAAGSDDASPSFNVTLHAKSTYSWVKFCSSGRATIEVVYSGMVIAMTDVEPFCVDAKGDKVITATASPGWSVLPSFLQERMESDRQHGRIQLQVDFGFHSVNQAHPEVEETFWVRCYNTLTADQPYPCSSYIFVGGC